MGDRSTIKRNMGMLGIIYASTAVVYGFLVEDGMGKEYAGWVMGFCFIFLNIVCRLVNCGYMIECALIAEGQPEIINPVPKGKKAWK